MATDKNILNLNFSAFKKALQEWMGSHDHDGTDSTAVTTGTPAAGALAASAGGRAIMADNYFDATALAAKIANDAMTAAFLAAKVADDALTNAFCDAAFAANAFAADADSRAIFADGIWNLAKMAATAKYQTLSYNVEDLAAGVDITDRPIYFVPANLTSTLISADIIPLGNPAGIDDSNKCTILLTDGTNTIVSKEFDSSPAFPSAGVVTNLGTLDTTHKILAAGEKLTLSVTNGTTANPPAFVLQLTYVLADA